MIEIIKEEKKEKKMYKTVMIEKEDNYQIIIII